MFGLGEQLRAAREAQGLALADVAERTHIRFAYLAALESGDLAALPPRVYAEGIVRTYSVFLGLDPDAALRELSAALGPGEAPDVRPHLRSIAGGAPGWPRSVAAAVALLALLALMGLGLLLWHGEAAPASERVSPPTPRRPVPVDRGATTSGLGEELPWLLGTGLRIGAGRD